MAASVATRPTRRKGSDETVRKMGRGQTWSSLQMTTPYVAMLSSISCFKSGWDARTPSITWILMQPIAVATDANSCWYSALSQWAFANGRM
jgi:hypothetical protein